MRSGPRFTHIWCSYLFTFGPAASKIIHPSSNSRQMFIAGDTIVEDNLREFLKVKFCSFPA